MKLKCTFKSDNEYHKVKKGDTAFIDGYVNIEEYIWVGVFIPNKRKIAFVDADDLDVLGYSEIPTSTVSNPVDCDCGGECVQEGRNESVDRK